MPCSTPTISLSLTASEILVGHKLDASAAPELEIVHRLDFEGLCPACGTVSHLRFDCELVVVDEFDTIGSALQHTCRSCSGSRTRSFIARTDLTDDDLCKVLEMRVK